MQERERDREMKQKREDMRNVDVTWFIKNDLVSRTYLTLFPLHHPIWVFVFVACGPCIIAATPDLSRLKDLCLPDVFNQTTNCLTSAFFIPLQEGNSCVFRVHHMLTFDLVISKDSPCTVASRTQFLYRMWEPLAKKKAPWTQRTNTHNSAIKYVIGTWGEESRKLETRPTEEENTFLLSWAASFRFFLGNMRVLLVLSLVLASVYADASVMDIHPYSLSLAAGAERKPEREFAAWLWFVRTRAKWQRK